MIEILPAILCQTREDLAEKIESVPSAYALHIDLMDGKFVNNKTVEPEDLGELPTHLPIEFHLMVSDPAGWIRRLPGGNQITYEVHIESVFDDAELSRIEKLVEKKGSRLALVINPPTPLEKLEALLSKHPDIRQVLVMTVNPGWAGQKYIAEMEEKMKKLRARYPKLVIEVDGGVGKETGARALKAGANRLAAANALFGQSDPDTAYQELKRLMNL